MNIFDRYYSFSIVVLLLFLTGYQLIYFFLRYQKCLFLVSFSKGSLEEGGLEIKQTFF